LLYVLPPNESHFDTVKKVAWRPSTTSTKEDEEDMLNLTLVSCGQDNGVRIFKLTIKRSEYPPDKDAVEEIKEAPTNVVESGPKKKLICLVSNGCHDRIQSANQSKALDWFIAGRCLIWLWMAWTRSSERCVISYSALVESVGTIPNSSSSWKTAP